MESVTKVLNESMLLWALFNVRLKWRNSFWGMPTNCPNASLS